MPDIIEQRLTKGQYLQLIGIDQWELRDSPQTTNIANISANDLQTVSANKPAAQAPIASVVVQPIAPNSSSQKIVQDLTHQQTVQKINQDEVIYELEKNNDLEQKVRMQQPDLDNINTLKQLMDLIATCTQCEISATRINAVFGIGNPDADLMIIGQALDPEEDKQGEPFIGPAGKLLDKMLGSIGLKRNQVFITNILKCRPTNNRDPLKAELVNCMPFLNKQIELVQPKVILALGDVSAQNLLGNNRSIVQLRGQPHDYGDSGVPLLVTFHPEYLLSSPAEKAKVWDDIKFVRFLLSQDD